MAQRPNQCFVSCAARLILFLCLVVAVGCGRKQRVGVSEPEKPITFLSDSDPMYALLEELQRIAYEDDPKAFRWTGDAKQRESLGGLLQKLDEIDGRVEREPGDFRSLKEEVEKLLARGFTTRFEEPWGFFLLRGVADEIEDTLGKELSVKPALGTLPLGTVNAQTVFDVQTGASLVVANTPLFAFCHELTKIAISTVTFSGEDEDTLSIDVSKETFDAGPRHDIHLIERLAGALEDFSKRRMIIGQALPGRFHAKAVAPLVHAMEVFALGHEYGHIMLNHRVDLNDSAASGDGTPRISGDDVLRAWGREEAADIYGYMLMDRINNAKRAKDRTDVEGGVDFTEYMRLAPLLFFELQTIAEEATYISIHGKEMPKPNASKVRHTIDFAAASLKRELSRHESGGADKSVTKVPSAPSKASHPPTWARAAIMRAQWETAIPKQMTADQKKFLLMGLALMSNIETMWGDMKPLWIKVIQQQRERDRTEPVGKP